MDVMLNSNDLIKIVLDSFEAERTGNIEKGRALIANDFRQQSMILSGDKIFPIFSNGNDDVTLDDTYLVKEREFHIWNIASNVESQTVFVELAEVEPRNNKKKVWPYVLVCKIENGKIKRSRHYGDPAVLTKDISVSDIEKVVRD